MRIPRGRAWLAGAALALGTVKGDYVHFNQGFAGDIGNRTGSNAAIFSTASAFINLFGWTTESGVVVENVTLFSLPPPESPATRRRIGFGKRALTDSGSITGGGSNSVSVSSAAMPSHPPISGGIVRRGLQTDSDEPTGIVLTVESTGTGGHVSFNNTDGIDSGLLLNMLYFEAAWNDGLSASRPFAIRSGAPAFDSAVDQNPKYTSTAPFATETGTPTANDNIGSSTNQDPNATTGDATGNTDGNLGGKPTTPAAEAANGGGGLARGAIIGIAVACGVVGLLLVAGLAWYLVRRGQKKKALRPVDSSYSSGNRGEELMAEKEAAADVDVAPHSPYSDDGIAGAGAGAGAGPSGTYAGEAAVAAGAVAAPHHPHLQDPPRSFTPYSDRPSAAAAATAAGTPSVRAASLAQTDDARVSVPSPVPGRATPRALTTPYAHLVEDGMTEDEIRRLEEEERQLDAAIEQAGRR